MQLGVIAFFAVSVIFSPIRTHAGEVVDFKNHKTCRKEHSGGCSADLTTCYTAPAGHFIQTTSVIEQHDLFGKNAFCNEEFSDYVTMSGEITVNGQTGIPFTFKEPTKLCSIAHSESGSGLDNFKKVFHAKGAVAQIGV